MDITNEFEKNRFLRHTLVAAITKSGVDASKLDYPYDVKLSINGEELDVIEVIKWLEELLDKNIQAQALDIVENKLNNVLNSLHDTISDAICNEFETIS